MELLNVKNCAPSCTLLGGAGRVLVQRELEFRLAGVSERGGCVLLGESRHPAAKVLRFGADPEEGTGRYLVVIWQFVMEDPLMIYPVTAYDVPEPRQRRK